MQLWEQDIYSKGFVRYFCAYLGLSKANSLDVAAKISITNIDNIFKTPLKYILGSEKESELLIKDATYPIKVTSFLLGLGFSEKIIKNIFQEYSKTDSLINTIKTNPYDLLVVEDMPFKYLDKIALTKLNIPENSPLRKKALIVYNLEVYCSKGSHLFISLETFFNLEFVNKEFDKEEFKKYLKELIFEKKIYFDTKRFYTRNNYLAEKESASLLKEYLFNNTENFFEEIDPDKFIKGYEEIQTENLQEGTWKNLKWSEKRFEFSEEQKEAIKFFIAKNIFVLTGLPGSGKTTVIKSFIDICNNRGLKVALLAPTGIAAKKLGDVTNSPSSTIHKKLGYTGKFFLVNEESPLDEDVFIIDEFSMVDQNLLYKFLKALPKDKTFKLVFVGDAAQLPSVAPGNVLYDLRQVKGLPTVNLTKIFRQEEASDIVINAHLINKGNTGLVNRKNDFIFLECNDQHLILKDISKIVTKLKDSSYQVLSPTYKGILGVTNLNNVLQDVLNPDQENLFETESYKYRPLDKILILKNDYENEVYNGETGYIREISKNKERIHILINNNIITYSFNESYSCISLDYARTIHKSQGNEYDYVILPLVNAFSIQLQRNLLYTAITRARKKVFILGQKEALFKAIKNNNMIKRNSLFGKKLEILLQENIT